METTRTEDNRHLVKWAFAILFTVLTFLGAVGSAVGWWAHDVLFDTDSWVETVGPVGTDPVVTEALADYTAEQLSDSLDPTAKLVGFLPDPLAPLGEMAGGAVENVIYEETTAFFESDLYADLWNGLNRTAHTAVIAVVRDQVPFLSTAEGTVSVDLEPVITPILDRVIVRLRQIADVLPEFVFNHVEFDDALRSLISEYEAAGLPEELSNVVIYESDRLAAVQLSVVLFDRLVIILPILTLVFAGLAVYLAPERKWMAPILLLGMAGAWLLSIWITDLIIGQLLSGISSDDAADVAEALLNGVTAGLDDLLRLMLIIAAIAGAGVVGWLWYSGRTDEEAIAD
jgi:hypothetical protein